MKTTLTDDRTHKEKKDPYYSYIEESAEVADAILKEFGAIGKYQPYAVHITAAKHKIVVGKRTFVVDLRIGLQRFVVDLTVNYHISRLLVERTCPTECEHITVDFFLNFRNYYN